MKIFGQDIDVLIAAWSNIVSWLVRQIVPSLLPKLLPKCQYEVEEKDGVSSSSSTNDDTDDSPQLTTCISIGRPGGKEQLRLITLKRGIIPCGYNLLLANTNKNNNSNNNKQGTNNNRKEEERLIQAQQQKKTLPSPFYHQYVLTANDIPSDCIVLHNKSFSINYADCTIRWGLYQSAKEYVGWPIIPGFDIAGTISMIGSNDSRTTNDDDDENNNNKSDISQNKTIKASEEQFKVGDDVFGVTLFGSYSNRLIVPKIQIRKIPKGLSYTQASSLPAVSLTALYALFLAGYYPSNSKKENQLRYTNRSILIHSAAGGVGSMLIQMSKILGLYPIVGIVGRSNKVQEAYDLGCDVVIDKSIYKKKRKSRELLWKAIRDAKMVNKATGRKFDLFDGYGCIMDANGISTLSDSYDHLSSTGRLIIFGFHSNLPIGIDMLSPIEWIKMGMKMSNMPKFDSMDLVVSNKSIMGFNLSFMSEEKELVSVLFNQICDWIETDLIRIPNIVEMKMDNISDAHDLIQSGKSIGKIVIKT